MSKKKKKKVKQSEKRILRAERRGTFLFVLLAIVLLIGGWAIGRILPAQAAADVPVVFSEVMSANTASWPAPDGSYRDWIELFNTSDEPFDLTGWKLTCTADTRGVSGCGLGVLGAHERCVIYTGEDTTGYSLSSNGETLYLTDTQGVVRRTLDVPALNKKEAYALGEDGEYFVTETPTPGAENTQAAWQALISNDIRDEGVYVNEVMAANAETLTDREGEPSDYIELYNSTGAEISLSGWYLTDDISDRRAWAFPDTQIPANGYLLVFASGKESAAGELCTSFKLAAKEDSVYLIDPEGHIASRMSWTRLNEDEALSRTEGGGETREFMPSPGSQNGTAEEIQLLRAAVPAQPLTHNDEGLYINEILCAGGDDGDWIELVNESSSAIDLSGWWLSDNEKHPRKWEFPEGTKIASKGFVRVKLVPEGTKADGLSCKDFRLSKAGGETVTLSRPDGAILDRVALSLQRGGVSYGRAKNKDTYRYFTEPTPSAANASKSYGGIASEITFSHAGGWVDGEKLALELTVDNDVNIYYTTDGSTPTTGSSTYSSAIALKSNAIVKAIAWKEDCVPTEIAAHTYLFGEPTTLRTVCISGSASGLTGSDGVLRSGARWPRDVYLEVFDYDGTPMLSQGCELITQGRSSRVSEEYKQKPFKLTAKGSYGKGRFKAKLFTNSDIDNYNSFLMRASGQDCYKTHFKDSVLTSLCADTNVYYQETELAALYVNGKYWGLYNMRQRVDPDTICRKHGWVGDEDVIEVITGSAAAATHGSTDYYREMMSYVKNHDFKSDGDVEGLRAYCDVESYLDYVIMMMYTSQEDLGNVRAYRDPNADGLFRWAVYDLDLSYLIDKNSVNMWLNSGGDIGSITTTSSTMFNKLMCNDSMRDYFLTRMGELLAGPLSSENVCGKIEERSKTISAEMKLTCAKWDWQYSTWEKNVKSMYSYASTRTAKMIQHAVKAFKLDSDEANRYFAQAIENESARAAADR